MLLLLLCSLLFEFLAFEITCYTVIFYIDRPILEFNRSFNQVEDTNSPIYTLYVYIEYRDVVCIYKAGILSQNKYSNTIITYNQITAVNNGKYLLNNGLY